VPYGTTHHAKGRDERCVVQNSFSQEKTKGTRLRDVVKPKNIDCKLESIG